MVLIMFLQLPELLKDVQELAHIAWGVSSSNILEVRAKGQKFLEKWGKRNC